MLTADELARLRATLDRARWEVAAAGDGEGDRSIRLDRRDCSTTCLDAGWALERLLARVRQSLPDPLVLHDEPHRLTGLYDPARAYRYEVGQRISLHRDYSYRNAAGDTARLAVIAYLNDGFEGGETSFPDADETYLPRAGDVLVFDHRWRHEGLPVRRGTKYVLRTDAMYSPELGNTCGEVPGSDATCGAS